MSESVGPNENTTETTAPPPLPRGPAAAPSTRSARRPIVALLLSLFPGLGQMYNGQVIKALVFFFAWAGCIWLVEDNGHFALMIPFVYLLNLIDAYRSAAYLGNRPAAAFEFDERPESPAWGVGLVVLGFVLLLNNLGWLPLHAVGRYWPVVLIAAGAAFVWNAARRRSAA